MQVACLKYLWGYVTPWVGKFTDEKCCVFRDVSYGDFSSRCKLKIESTDFLMMT
jgi:hypothetical protein